MCGRFTNLYRWRDLVRLMRLAYPDEELTPQYNVAPTQPAPVIRASESGSRAGEPQGLLMKWGLVPSWATDPSVGVRSFNARSETVSEKPTFRSAFRHRRCLVPISGFYEWKALTPREKQPYWIGRRDRQPFTLAGLWERWSGPESSTTPPAPPLQTFTILTTTPNALMKPLHDRMPVILHAADRERWLANDELDPSEAARLFQPSDDADFESYPVSKRVSNPRAQGPDLMEPVAERGPDQGLLF